MSLVITLTQFFAALRTAWRDPSFRSLAALTVLLLIAGTLIFHSIEGWSLIDSFYFSAITLSTVGYGDLSPQIDFGKLMTVFYIFMGFGLLAALLTRFADALLETERKGRERRHARRGRAQSQSFPVPEERDPVDEDQTSERQG